MSCDHCPRRGAPCLGEAGPRLCRKVDPAHPAYDPRYLTALEPPGEAGLAAAPPPPADVAPGLAEALADLARARGCRRKVAPPCGCRYGFCTRLGREVAPADCLACLRAGDDAGAAPPA